MVQWCEMIATMLSKFSQAGGGYCDNRSISRSLPTEANSGLEVLILNIPGPDLVTGVSNN